jgi:PKHD-type hydroxylase
MIVTIPDMLDLTELRQICQKIAEANFDDCRKTAGKRAKLVKKNEQLGADQTKLKEEIKKALLRHPEFKRVALPKKVRTPLISRYKSGMEYGLHVDNALMGSDRDTRTDISVTLFLNGPDSYEGGELEIESPFGLQLVKLPAGAAVVYPSSCLHRVCPVEKGERMVAVTWVQSLVRDPAKREILYELDQVRSYLHDHASNCRETNLADKNYSNLLRMWAES